MNYSLLWIFLILLGAYLYLNKSTKSQQSEQDFLQQGGTSLLKPPADVIERVLANKTLGVSANFSYLDQSISDGNPASTAGKINPIAYQDQWYKNCDKPNHVYFGTPNPLLQQMRPMSSPKDTMFYFANAKFSPECCQGGAPYSTSSGCVCAFAKQICKAPKEPITITPIPGPNSWQIDTN